MILLSAAAGAGGWWFGIGRYSPTPKLVGLAQSAALTDARNHHLDVHVLDGVNSDVFPAGVVLAQVPNPGARVLANTAIAVHLSLGPLMEKVPALTAGTSKVAVASALHAAGLAVGGASSEYSPTIATGTLIRTNPAAGQVLRHDTPVAVVLSKGPQPIPAPTLSEGELALSAQAEVRALGLVPHETKINNDTIPMGVVISQTTPAGSPVLPGGPVNYVVSLGPVMVQVPAVDGLTTSAAQSKLQAQGFTVTTDLPAGLGSTVYASRPQAGQTVAHGSNITIYVF